MKWSIENIVKMMKEDIRKYNELTGNKAVFEIPVEFNGRLKTTLAYFQYSNESARKISIGKVIFEDQYTDEQRIDTLKHELAHYIAYQIYGPGQGHNENWASICNKIGCIASPHMQPASAHHNSFILEKAILNGGTTIRSYESSEGVHGKFQQNLLVHNRENENCPNCKNKIIKIKVGGRGTYYCPNCQKL